MTELELKGFAERFLSAWNAQDVGRVVACYTDDLIYRDPNTRGEVLGADAFRRYLTKLFGAWKMTWALREGYPLAGNSPLVTFSPGVLRRSEYARDHER